MLDDQRKRRIELNAGPTARKKPMLNASSSTPSPILDTNHLNPADRTLAEPANHLNQSVGDDDLLENFRKEALWRQLQEYKRDLQRAQERIEESESQKSDVESRLAAIDICWNQLIEDVRVLFKDSCTNLDSSTHATLMSLPSTPTTLDRALHQRSTASKDLIIHLISLASSSSVASPDLEEIRARCRRLTAESASSRAALGLAESKLKQLQDQLDAAQEATRRAEKKLDRERSRTVKELDAQGQGGSTSQPPKSESRLPADDSPKPPAEQNGNGTHTVKPSSLPVCNGTDSTDHDSSKELDNARSRELETLKEQLLQRAHEIDILNWKMINLPDEIVRNTPAFTRLKAEVAHATLELERVRTLLEATQKEADDLRERQEEFRTKVVTEMTKRVEDMEKKLASKDADVTRIRATREEARSELHELKSRDVEKMKQVAQIRTLANSRQDRINALSSEVRRLKMRLAADVGDRNTVDFLATNEEVDVAKALQERLKIAEETITSLRAQIEQLAQDSKSEDSAPLIRSEAEARQDLVVARQRVESIDRLLGPDGNSEISEITKRLQAEVDRQQVLEAKLAAQEASASMLYTEVDRLSTAWAVLDEQNRDKVFKLAEHDEKVLKAVHEKAKADNRYFSAMRANETLKSQTAVLEKMAEKQTVTISKISDELRAVSARLTSAEKEITIHQKMAEAHKTKTTELSIENADLITRCSQHDQKVIELSALLRDRTAQAETEASARRTAEESVMNLEKEIQRSKLTGSNGRGGLEPAEVAELRSFNDDLTKMLKCNSCKQRFKSHVITRCMHLFCGACLEARLETRQRKCPTCSIAFGTNDVSAVYF
ncbi:hypothetical protein, variant [Puccinia triticina 1-1 BBBD Race 1]|uniref:E3 ubiquitin protein ligase n=2 Tax=Puccinia triticina TaxID=208348 RepID=A0A180GWE1_PUCT1|nr:uncharacterized protein PtA15_12A487 [Puccinia triticina]OAV96668.1 hypothetical protein PTTG_02947 [Puccinia triticina 1-1 BBBD Race 1]OAV96669.1 hypothetical protein, variant [Puccinia triticina 1-1 BBBD Race 1]WAQ90497.1 hypothetical protein PtA15_12A487 [Puccinia triticina]WAR61815.1 hypothetical protein PtB15_12B507 [Puccinia triticina]